MNWPVALVLGTIFVLIPASLVITFLCFRDTHKYQSHYTQNGFSQESQEGPPTSHGPLNSWEQEPQKTASNPDSGEQKLPSEFGENDFI